MASYNLRDLGEYLDHLCKNKRIKLTREEERVLYEKARNGDLDAKRDLLLSNSGFLYMALAPFEYRADLAGVSLSDIASELIEDVIEKRFDTFDPKQKTRLGNYLFNKKFISPKIKQRIQRHSKHGITNSNINLRLLYNSLPSEGNDEQDRENIPSDELFLYHAIANIQKQQPTSAEEARDRIDYETLQEEVSKLPNREQRILNEHYLERKSFSQIARELNITHQRVNQIHGELIKKLRKKLGQK